MPPEFEPAYVFTGELSPGDWKRYLPLPFDVPPGTGHLRIDLTYEPQRIPDARGAGNLLCVGLFDPAGFRGNQHSGASHKVVEVGPDRATPGFRAGPLPAGRWTLELDTFMVLPGAPLAYRAEVRLAEASDRGAGPPADRAFRPQPPLRRGPAWYRGDLHMHTTHSDGRQSVAELLATAREHRLDFVALTDHNTVTQLLDPAIDGQRDLLIIPGMELTTYYGHAVALGVTDWVDWRTHLLGGRAMADCLAEIAARGGVSVLAHLAALGDPACTGCAWLYTDQMPGSIRAMEVWNGVWYEPGGNNPINLRIWYRWLDAGHRLPAVAGSDYHRPERYALGPGLSRIHAPELSAAALLEGISCGHVMLSSGPELYLEANLVAGGRAMMGDAVPRAQVESVSLRWRGGPPAARANLVAGGQAVATWPGGEGATTVALPPGARWLVAELRGPDDAMLALTNPLYLGEPAGALAPQSP